MRGEAKRRAEALLERVVGKGHLVGDRHPDEMEKVWDKAVEEIASAISPRNYRALRRKITEVQTALNKVVNDPFGRARLEAALNALQWVVRDRSAVPPDKVRGIR